MNLSVVIIAKNEEKVIGNCIESIKNLADEVLVIDSGSRDNTSKIAKKLGAKVYSHNFTNFSDQRNYAMSLAKGKWVLYLDADEEATLAFKKEVNEIINKNEIPDNKDIKNGYFIKRKTFYYDRDWNFTDRVQRLFKKDKFITWEGVVHETPKVDGEFGVVENPIVHKTHRDLSRMVTKTNHWSEYEAKLRFDKNHPKMSVVRFFRVMLTAFYHSYFKEKGYKNGTAGVVEAMYQCFSMFITYAKLWERQEK